MATNPASDHTKARLRFQKEAADVQKRLSVILKDTTAFLDDLAKRQQWIQPSDDEAAAKQVNGFWAETERWGRLKPPEKLHSIWTEIARALNDLGLLMEKIPVLSQIEGEDLSQSVADLRNEFVTVLAQVTELEGRLLDEETALRDEDLEGAEARTEERPE